MCWLTPHSIVGAVGDESSHLYNPDALQKDTPLIKPQAEEMHALRSDNARLSKKLDEANETIRNLLAERAQRVGAES